MARAVAVAVLGLGAAVAPHVADAQEHPPHGGEGDGILPPGDWSPAQREELLGMVEAAETDLPAFADPADLPEEYIDFGVAVGGYWHFVNWEIFDDDHVLDPQHPEALVYHREYDPDTGGYTPFRLVSAMYILPSQYTMDNLPADLAWLPGLHVHPDICVNETTKKFSGLGPSCSPGSRPFDRPPMMHVWLEDPGCGHRFGGIDVSGLHCDAHGHPGGPGSTTSTTEHQHPTTTQPGHQHPTTTQPGHQHPTTSTSTPGHHHGDPPAATPIHRHPTDAG